MADAVLGFVIRVAACMLFDGLLFVTARTAMPLLTFGRWQVKPLADCKAGMAWRGFERQRDGTMLVDFEPAILFGLAIWLVIGCFFVAALRGIGPLG